MATRRQGREWALQMLFQADLNPDIELDVAIPSFWRQQYTCRQEEHEEAGRQMRASAKPIEDQIASPRIRAFTEALVRGVHGRLDELDVKIEEHTRNWALHRMGSVERNVLRLAFYELLYAPDVPPAVVLNEAIDLAKYFSNAESGRFVNGILDQFNSVLRRAGTAGRG